MVSIKSVQRPVQLSSGKHCGPYKRTASWKVAGVVPTRPKMQGRSCSFMRKALETLFLGCASSPTYDFRWFECEKSTVLTFQRLRFSSSLSDFEEDTQHPRASGFFSLGFGSRVLSSPDTLSPPSQTLSRLLDPSEASGAQQLSWIPSARPCPLLCLFRRERGLMGCRHPSGRHWRPWPAEEQPLQFFTLFWQN